MQHKWKCKQCRLKYAVTYVETFEAYVGKCESLHIYAYVKICDFRKCDQRIFTKYAIYAAITWSL